MTTIPEDIVERTWREVAAFDSRTAWRAMEKVGGRQPALLAYVLAETKDSRRQVQELALYLFFVVLRMFERLPGHRLKRIPIEHVERRADTNEALFERLEPAHDRFLKRTAEVLAESQPYVVRYLSEAILEKEDPGLDLTDDESGLVFLVLKTVVDLLDQATMARR